MIFYGLILLMVLIKFPEVTVCKFLVCTIRTYLKLSLYSQLNGNLSALISFLIEYVNQSPVILSVSSI